MKSMGSLVPQRQFFGLAVGAVDAVDVNLPLDNASQAGACSGFVISLLSFGRAEIATRVLARQGICSYNVPMPEQHREKRGTHVFTLTAAFDAGYLVRARCMVCNIRRVYDPADLKQLVGDIGCEELCRRMRCEQCRQGGDNMDIEFWYPTAQERQGLVIRRLVGTRMIRKVIWRDEQAP